MLFDAETFIVCVSCFLLFELLLKRYTPLQKFVKMNWTQRSTDRTGPVCLGEEWREEGGWVGWRQVGKFKTAQWLERPDHGFMHRHIRQGNWLVLKTWPMSSHPFMSEMCCRSHKPVMQVLPDQQRLHLSFSPPHVAVSPFLSRCLSVLATFPLAALFPFWQSTCHVLARLFRMMSSFLSTNVRFPTPNLTSVSSFPPQPFDWNHVLEAAKLWLVCLDSVGYSWK